MNATNQSIDDRLENHLPICFLKHFENQVQAEIYLVRLREDLTYKIACFLITKHFHFKSYNDVDHYYRYSQALTM